MRYAVDVDFDHAARLASRVLFAKGARRNLRPLARILLSKRTLGPGERRCLAELIAGHLRRPRGQAPLKRAERQRREAAVARVAAVKAERKTAGLPRLSHEAMVNLVAKELGIRVPDQLREWVRTKKYCK